jgi:hypothetical protein
VDRRTEHTTVAFLADTGVDLFIQRPLQNGSGSPYQRNMDVGHLRAAFLVCGLWTFCLAVWDGLLVLRGVQTYPPRGGQRTAMRCRGSRTDDRRADGGFQRTSHGGYVACSSTLQLLRYLRARGALYSVAAHHLERMPVFGRAAKRRGDGLGFQPFYLFSSPRVRCQPSHCTGIADSCITSQLTPRDLLARPSSGRAAQLRSAVTCAPEERTAGRLATL